MIIKAYPIKVYDHIGRPPYLKLEFSIPPSKLPTLGVENLGSPLTGVFPLTDEIFSGRGENYIDRENRLTDTLFLAE